MFRGCDWWESKTSGKSGYSPASANEWQPGIYAKRRIKCGDYMQRQLMPVSGLVSYRNTNGSLVPNGDVPGCHMNTS
ncbi:TOTE conflict system archaeo-eukaryotic primase domain-containing protein [Escherichia coli]|uniref:TOTE conflict system archaeo-eukaryotic primase domain-containing protein n=1 Tax=Escherichia coli TaxID=562 RepID=UPI0035B56A87